MQKTAPASLPGPAMSAGTAAQTMAHNSKQKPDAFLKTAGDWSQQESLGCFQVRAAGPWPLGVR